MKAIGIIGFKKSGKTTLATLLARSLMKKGHRVAVIKHASQVIDHGDTDSGLFMKEIPEVAVITPENAEILFRDSLRLKDLISYLSADFLLIEGFKEINYFPKIVCLRNEEEREQFNDGLTLFTAGSDASLKDKKVIDYVISNEQDIDKMVIQIEKRAFLLPDMNCGDCGYQDCYGLARAIVKGTESWEKCVYYFEDSLSIYINKKRVYLNSFMSKLYQSILQGMLSPLKDINSLDKAMVEIKWNATGELKEKKSP